MGVSDFSDVYKAGCNFAIVIMYSYRGKFKWTTNDGKIPTKYQNPEFRGRFLYVVFKNTSEWRPENFGTGGGQVHGFIFQEAFGIQMQQLSASCGGAAIKDGVLHFSSGWLNNTTSSDPSFENKWESDGKKLMSAKERTLMKFATQLWMRHGNSNNSGLVPADIHAYCRGKQSGEHLPESVPINQL